MTHRRVTRTRGKQSRERRRSSASRPIADRIADKFLELTAHIKRVPAADGHGSVFQVPAGWRGISDWSSPHVFRIVERDNDDTVIEYVLDPLTLYTGRVSQQWIQLPGLQPERYSDYLLRMGWYQARSEDDMVAAAVTAG